MRSSTIVLFSAVCFAIAVSLLSAVALFAGEGAAEVSSMPEVGKPVHCIIRGEKTCTVGEAPKIEVSLVNQTDKEIYLVGSLDASDCKWRYPHSYFEVFDPDGKQVPVSVPRCGLMNPLRTKDFVKIAPDKSFNPYQSVDDYGFFTAHQLSAANFSKPGEYRIRFIYSTASDDLVRWQANGGDAGLARLLKAVPKVEVKSEEFVITVMPKAVE